MVTVQNLGVVRRFLDYFGESLEENVFEGI